MASSPLLDLIIDRIRRSGPLTFAEYMRMALYQPEYGYYVSGPPKMGWEGDYYTSSDVSPFFAHCVGRQLYEMWVHLKRPVPFVVHEQGAGRARLEGLLRSWAEKEAPDFARALDYRSTDIRQQFDALSPASDHTSQPANQPHVLFSNELIDAFPVHIVQMHQGQLQEIYVAEDNGRLYEISDEPSSPEVANYLDRFHIHWRDFEEGWRAEVNLDALQWMRQSAHLLLGDGPHKRHGFLLAIDYGEKAKQLYTAYRRRGTLACYYRHQLGERPLIRPGEQDLTAHVNFSALIEEGRQAGLRLHSFETQGSWLTRMGIYDELDRIRKRDFVILDNARSSDRGQIALLQWHNLRQRVSALTDPHGMGNFKVLLMKR